MNRRSALRVFMAAAATAAVGTNLVACSTDSDTGSSTKPSGGPAKLVPLMFAVPAPNAVYWAMYVALEKGMFKDAGFEAETGTAQGSAGAAQQVAAGSAQVALGTPDAMINAAIAGADLKLLSPCILQSPLTLVGQPDIDSFAKLKGQTIGVSAINGGEITLLRMLLEKHGLNEGSYNIVVAGTTPAKAAALQAKSVGAAVLFSPTDFTFEREGFSRIGSTTEVTLAKSVPLTVYAVSEKWASVDDNGTNLRGAFGKANDWLLDPANKEEAVDILATAAKQPAEDVVSTYELWFEKGKLWPAGPAPLSTDSVDATLEMMIKAGDIKGEPPSVDKLRIA